MPTFIYHTFLYSPALWVSRAHSKGLKFTRRWIYQNNGTHRRRICAVWIKASAKHHSERYKCFCERVRKASRNADWESIRQHYQLTVRQYPAEHDVSIGQYCNNRKKAAVLPLLLYSLCYSVYVCAHTSHPHCVNSSHCLSINVAMIYSHSVWIISFLLLSLLGEECDDVLGFSCFSEDIKQMIKWKLRQAAAVSKLRPKSKVPLKSVTCFKVFQLNVLLHLINTFAFVVLTN